MSLMGEQMIRELAASLSPNLTKTAAKKDDKDDKEDKAKKEEKKDKAEKKEEEEKKDKAEKKEKKDKDDKKKKEAVMQVLNGLSKLAENLDEIGADDASSLVDDALRVIVYNLEAEDEKKN